MPNSRIIHNGDQLVAAARTTRSAADSLRGAQPELVDSIPGDTFGVVGTPVSAVGNLLGGGIAEILGSLATLAEKTADATDAINSEFERVEQDALARLKWLSTRRRPR